MDFSDLKKTIKSFAESGIILEIAIATMEMRKALVVAGFTDEEAMDLIKSGAVKATSG